MPSIIQQNGLWSDSERESRSLAYNKIGYQHIKDRRMRRRVDVAAGGCLGDYVPFYFAPRSPMLFTINRGNVPDYNEGQNSIVHLVSSVNIVLSKKVLFAFTDRHADLAHAEYSVDIDRIEEYVDFDVMPLTYWSNTDAYPDRKERRQAEFLVHRFFSWNNVVKIAVLGDTIANAAKIYLNAAEHQPPIEIKPEWYY